MKRFEINGYEVEVKSEPRPYDCSQSSDIKDYSYCDSIEPKIGEVFEYKDIVLKCEKGNCPECFFESDTYECPCNAFNCEKRERKDRTGVCFVEVSQKEKPTASDEPSPTEGEDGGVHKRTPQEIADFFDCYVAMDEDGYWFLYSKEPIIGKGDFSWSTANCGTGDILAISESFLLLSAEEDHNWRTLYRPHRKPIVMEED